MTARNPDQKESCMSTTCGLIALSADRPKRWRLHISNRDGSLLQSFQLVEVTGQPALAQFNAMHAARALQFTQTLLGVMSVQPRKEVCQNMPNGKLRTFELKSCPLQVFHSVLYFRIHFFRFSNGMSNSARWRPRLFCPKVGVEKLSNRYPRLTDALDYKVVIAFADDGSRADCKMHRDLSPVTKPGMPRAAVEA